MPRSLRRPMPTAVLTALTLAVALTATACGSSDDGGQDEGTSSKPSKGRHAVKHARGTATVPDQPKRVVVLDTDALDSAVTLGVTPVGATRAFADAPFSTYLPQDKLRGVKDVGLIAEPNLEAILELKPDLILGSEVRDAKNYDELSTIAPTVFTKTTGPDWRKNFQLHADALGKKDRAKDVVTAYEAHVDELVDSFGGRDKAKDTTVAMVRFVEGADTRLYLNDTFVGSIFTDLGVGRPANQDREGFSLDVSPEQIDKANADVVFWSTYGDPDKSREKKITSSALWKGLDAVKNTRAYQVDDALWMLGIGYTGANRVLDEMEENLAG